MRFRSVCSFVALCVVLWTSGCFFDHGCCRRHLHERDCGCPCPCASPCQCSSYAPCDQYGAPPLAPVIPPPTPVMPAVPH